MLLHAASQDPGLRDTQWQLLK
uniref:Uncharacterized protein n=1 Tax=Triticum urartu TaxID=4572 RepID=A0A8R7PCZ0_TRIUA